MKIKRRLGDEAGAADSLDELGKLLRDAGQMREAIAAFNECLEIHQRLNNPNTNRACKWRQLGLPRLVQSQRLNQSNPATWSPDWYKMGIDLELLDIIHERQGEYTAALEKYQQAQCIYQQAMPTNLPIIERHIARVRAKM